VKYDTGRLFGGRTLGLVKGIAVTPIQLLAAIGAVANDGVLMKPYFVKEIRDQQGKLIDQTVPEEISQVMICGKQHAKWLDYFAL